MLCSVGLSHCVSAIGVSNLSGRMGMGSIIPCSVYDLLLHIRSSLLQEHLLAIIRSYLH